MKASLYERGGIYMSYIIGVDGGGTKTEAVAYKLN